MAAELVLNDSASGYGHVTKTIKLTKGHTYTATAKGTTIQLNGIGYEKQRVLADGYYLIGLTNFDVAGLTANELFTQNPENEDEYQLSVTLAEGDELKVVKVEYDEAVAWYPDGENNNYEVDANHAGEKTVYFRPDGQGGEGWFHGVIYIEKNIPSAVENIQDDKAQSTKVIENGVLYLKHEGQLYNVQGIRVR